MTTLTKIENLAAGLLEFHGNKYALVEVSSEEIKELDRDIHEEYDDLNLEYIGFHQNVAKLELLGIHFTLKVTQ